MIDAWRRLLIACESYGPDIAPVEHTRIHYQCSDQGQKLGSTGPPLIPRRSSAWQEAFWSRASVTFSSILTVCGDHIRSATARARGHIRASMLDPSTCSDHCSAMPPSTRPFSSAESLGSLSGSAL